MPNRSFFERVRAALDHARFRFVLAAVAFLAHAPTLGSGYLLDDYTHRYFAQGERLPGSSRGPWDLYRFADGGPGIREAMDSGLHPWWTSPNLKLAFFRPVASLMRVAEEKLFADHAFVPHLLTCVLFVATTLAVHAALKRWIGGAAAALGALFFAVDDAHSTTVTWLAARHSLLATFFAVLAIAVFLAARERGKVSFGAAALVFLALLSSEAALSVIGFFVALVVFDGSRPASRWSERLRGLAPIGAVVLVWLVLYVALGYGSQGSGYYVDPARDPVRFAGVAVKRLPALALAQLFLPPSELSSLQPTLAPGIAVVGFLALGLALLFAVRAKEAARARGLLAAFVISLVPACGTNADDRLLMLPGVAAMGLVALACRAAYHERARLAPRVALVAIGVVHLGLAMVLGPLRGTFFATSMSRFVDRGAASLFAIPKVEDKTVIVVTSPDGLLPSSMYVKYKLAKRPVFRSGRILVTAPAGDVTLTRPDTWTLVVSASGGMMRDPFLPALRAEPLRAGFTIAFPDVTITVTDVAPDGAPTRIVFAFREPADRVLPTFVQWKGGRYQALELPSPGSSVALDPIDFSQALVEGSRAEGDPPSR